MAKASRAKWSRSSYYRKNSDTWRNPYTGRISDKPSGGRTLSKEVRYEHDYGYDKVIKPGLKFNEKKKKLIKL